jgi:hypothetical protein
MNTEIKKSVRKFLLVAVILLIGSAITEAQTIVTAKLPYQIEVKTCLSMPLTYSPPPSGTSKVACDIEVNSNLPAWGLSIAASNNGYMKSDIASLINPMEIQYDGISKGKAITLTGAYQLYREYGPESKGLTIIPTRFIQKFNSKDKPGSYAITIYYQGTPI